MLKNKILALYGGQAPVASSDQETREEYEARRKAKKDKKKKKHHHHDHQESEGGKAPSKPKVIEQVLYVKDAEEEPFGVRVPNELEDATKPINELRDSDEEGPAGDRTGRRRRKRVDSTSESDEEEDNGHRQTRRRPRVETSSDEEEEGVPERNKQRLELDSDNDVALNRKRGRRDRNESISSQSELEQGPNAKVDEVDSDGDVAIRRRRRRRSSSSSSSSLSENGRRPLGTIGLKSKEEFARIMEAKDQAAASELDEYGLGKGQETVYRDKRTGEISQAATKTQQEIERENEILRYELNMGAFDKLMIKGVKEQRRPQDDILDDDPMARFLRKSTPEDELTLTGKPKYKGRAPPPNRFQIQPGYRWDGVDRSNGFESKLLRRRNERLAQ